MRHAGDATRPTEVLQLWSDGPPPLAHRARPAETLFAEAAIEALKRGIWSLETVSRGIVEASSDCVEVLDLQGRLRFMNREATRTFGPVNSVGHSEADWVETWPADARITISAALAAARVGGAVRFTGCRRVADGGNRWWDVALSPIIDEQSTLLGFLAASRDISDVPWRIRTDDGAEVRPSKKHLSGAEM